MISLLQQTAPAAVGTTPPGPVSTYTVPLTEAPADAPPAPPVTITYDAAPAATPATDAAAGSDAPIAEVPAPDLPAADLSTTGAPVVVDAPAVGTPVVEAPVVETPVIEAPAAVVTTDPQAHATDAIVVPDATGAATAPAVPEVGMGHAPVAADHATTAVVDGAHGAATHVVADADAHGAVAAGAHDAAASAGMPQLDFSTFGNQIFWLLVALALIYFALSRVALPRINRILADRQGLMTNDLMAAEDFKQKAKDAEAAYDKALADARAEANKIVAANRAEMQGELDAAIAKADAEISARTVESERRIGEIRASAETDARTVASDVAAELVRTFGGQPDAGTLGQAVDKRMKGAAQ